MIDPKELRIGNVVMYGSDIAIIYRLGATYCYSNLLIENTTGVTTDEIKYHSGIPLTEEWLLKMGFKKRQDPGIFGMYTKDECWDLDKFEGGYYFKDHELNHINSAPMICVHQMQNLFFALTGEELTIKQ